MQEHQFVDFAERYTAWCSQDVASVAAFYSVFSRWLADVNDGTRAVRRSAITKVAQSFMTAFPVLRVVMAKMLVQGDHADYHWTLIGTDSGQGGTGRRVRISAFELRQGVVSG